MKSHTLALRTDSSDLNDFWHYAEVPFSNYCPVCGQLLWVAPDGETPYCNAIHTDKELKKLNNFTRNRVDDIRNAIFEGNIDMNDDFELTDTDVQIITNTILDKFIFTPNDKTLHMVIKSELERVRLGLYG